MTTFDLLSEPWLPVLRHGRRELVSLTTAFSQAHLLDGLAMDDAHQAVAALRQVLLPIMLRAVPVPRDEAEWSELWDAAELPIDVILDYLDQHRHRFDLFDPQVPFGQVAGLHTASGEVKPISLLIPRLASGNNVPLFNARTEADPPVLTAGEAALAVLAAQCWDTAAIKSGAAGDPQVAKGKTTGNPTGPLGQLGVVVPWGRTLKDTLLLNCALMPAGPVIGDLPPWEQPPRTQRWRKDARPVGPVQLMTWQARRIRLVPVVDQGTGPVGVRHVVLCAGDRLPPTNSAGAPNWRVEWHTAWKPTGEKKAGAALHRPVRHEPGRAAWRGLEPLLATRPGVGGSTAPRLLQQVPLLVEGRCLPETYPLQVLTVGIRYGNQSAVIEDVMVDLIPLPVLALATEHDVHAFLLELVDQADRLRLVVNHLSADLRAASGAAKVPWDRSEHPGDRVIHLLSHVVLGYLEELQRHPEHLARIRAAWPAAAREAARDVAEELLNAAPDGTFLGRRSGDAQGSVQHPPMNVAVAERRYLRAVRQLLGDPTPAGSNPAASAAQTV